MAKKVTHQRNHYTSLQIISFLLLSVIQRFTFADSGGTAPLITPNGPDITALPGQNVKISCHSTEPIHWRFHKNFYGDFEIENFYNPKNKLPYESVLELFQVAFTYVDYYYCVKNGSESETSVETLVKTNQASNIYLFVEDRRHPLVQASIPILEGIQNEDIVIPCKPTSKKFEVQLIKEGNERNKFEWTFNPTDGFRIRIKNTTDAGQYTCHAKFDVAEKFDIYFTIQVKPRTKFLNKPIIATDDYGIEGDQIEFNCTAEAEWGVELDMEWELPNKNIAIKEDRVDFIPPLPKRHETNATLYKAIGKLTVFDLNKTKDVGVYKCTVKDNSGNNNAATLSVNRILGPEEWFINITPTVNSTLIVNSNQKQSIFSAKFSGIPIPLLTWFDIDGNLIPWSMEKNQIDKLEAILDQQNQLTTLQIYGPQLTDSGYYTLLAENGQIQKEHKFQLLVKDKPQLSMSDIFYHSDENVNAICEIRGYPPSTVAWSFIPCENLEFGIICDESKTSIFSNEMIKTTEKSPLKQISTLNFTPTGMGITICEAKNTEGRSEARADVIEGNLNEYLTIWNKNELPIVIGDDVSIICAAPNTKFASINWYRDDVLVKSTMNIQVMTNQTQYSHQKEIHWKSITKEAAGKYICRANVIKDNSYVNKSWELNIIEPTMPEIVTSNIKSEQLSYSLGESAELLCNFSGIPPPKITWFKNEHEIAPESNSSQISLHNNNAVLSIHIDKGDEGKYKCVAENRAGSVSRETKLKITNIPTVDKTIMFGILGAILVLVIVILILFVCFRRVRKRRQELRAERLANMRVDKMENIYHQNSANSPFLTK